jgi:cysteine-rich repeat protein
MRNNGLLLVAFAAGCVANDPAFDEEIGSNTSEIRGGTAVPLGTLPAVGRLLGSGCTGTLITQSTVLTAAHCVCTGETTTEPGETPTHVCGTRSQFTFTDVFPVDDPATPIDESATRAWVTISGDVVVHPDYTVGQWLSNDYALILLDQPAYERVIGVSPIQVEVPAERPEAGDAATIVGFGRTDVSNGDDCNQDGGGIKRRASLSIFEVRAYDVNGDGDNDDTIDEAAGRTLLFRNASRGSCSGDSGGPALNSAGRVIGVSSTGGGDDSAYDATFVAYDWIADNACTPFDPTHPQPAFCDDPLCPCTTGEGDCDDDDHCRGSLDCRFNIGDTVGLPADYDVCGPNCPALDPSDPDPSFCATGCLCDIGEGDCDGDEQCAGDLICGLNNGAPFGLPASYEVCIRPGPSCGNGQPDAGEVCDDANRASGDGCSPTCRPEVGWSCPSWNQCIPNVPCSLCP